MTITGQNFTIYQGDNKQIIITVRDDDGVLVNLTGYGAVWCAHKQTPADIIFQKTTLPSEGISIPNPESGEIIITIDGVDTADLTPKIYGHQCEIEDSSGNHATITTGYMKVIRSITHHVI